MRKLETNTGRKDAIFVKFDKNLSISDAFEEVLREWRSRESENATLRLLVLHLKYCNLVSHADALEQEFITNNSGVESFEIPVSGNRLQRKIPNPPAIYSTCQYDMKRNEERTQASKPPSTITVLSMQTKEKVRKILLIAMCTALFAFLLGLGLYFGIPATKNVSGQNTSNSIAEKATTTNNLEVNHENM